MFVYDVSYGREREHLEDEYAYSFLAGFSLIAVSQSFVLCTACAAYFL